MPNGALDLPVTQKQLHGSQIASAAVDQRRFGSAKRVCGEDVWIDTNASDPFRHEPSILSGGHAAIRTLPTAEYELAGLLAGRPQVVVDSLASLLCQLKPDRLSGFRWRTVARSTA